MHTPCADPRAAQAPPQTDKRAGLSSPHTGQVCMRHVPIRVPSTAWSVHRSSRPISPTNPTCAHRPPPGASRPSPPLDPAPNPAVAWGAATGVRCTAIESLSPSGPPERITPPEAAGGAAGCAA
eukprot:TRINITY_DN12745_c0_g1_i1.p4 TRINITY_DN12745_c0_g1~~TRINITY_DN12745_c0_g1_i1.p4  ORF type:complete len:124 (-),score=10.58 TRINITY_DN12745_c0_g1_i1:651-1022(-)